MVQRVNVHGQRVGVWDGSYRTGHRSATAVIAKRLNQFPHRLDGKGRGDIAFGDHEKVDIVDVFVVNVRYILNAED